MLPEAPAAAGYVVPQEEANRSAVSWAAIFAGMFTAIVISLLLLALGSGIGLTAVSPWSGAGASATTFTVVTAIWLIVVQWLSAAAGGYLTGRLRTKWTGMHTDEVFFRDTAHGFLSWAVATVVVVAMLGSGLSSVVGGAARIAGTAAGAAGAAGAGAMAQQAGGMDYSVDALFRSDQPNANASPQESRAEATRILAKAVADQTIAPADRTYLARLIAARTGISQADAEKRIDDATAQLKAAETRAREAADAARKAASSLAFFTFFSLLIGAFIAAVAGAIGGAQRDQY